MAVAFSLASTPAGVNGSGTTVTFTACAIGTAASDRIVAVLVTSEDATAASVTAVTVGGADCVKAAGAPGAQLGAMNASIWHQLIQTSSTADIIVKYSSTAPSSTNNRITTYAVTGADFAGTGGTASSTDMDASAPLNVSIVVPAGGGALAAACGAVSSTTAKTWTNLTEALEASTTTYTHTIAASTATFTGSVTCQGTTNQEDGALAIVVYKPAVTWSKTGYDSSDAVVAEARKIYMTDY